MRECVDAVEGKIEVYFDGGIWWGTDVIKALAYGAKAVFIGRPVLYGLAHGGQTGVESIFQILNDELWRAMILTGCLNIAQITWEWVIHETYSAKL